MVAHVSREKKFLPHKRPAKSLHLTLIETGDLMSRSSIMTTGALLVLLGIQLNYVDTYVVKSQFTDFCNERFSVPLFLEEVPSVEEETSDFGSGFGFGNNNQNLSKQIPTSQASFSKGTHDQDADAVTASVELKQITPPSWTCWPLIFLGAVLFLHGAALGRPN